MFGINSWELVGQIAEGWTKDIVKANQDMHDKRMEICKKCPLYSIQTDRCDAKKCMNTVTGEIVLYPGPDIICGCNCFMSKKSRVNSAHCVLGKW